VTVRVQIINGQKRCGSCKEMKDLDAFWENPKAATGYHSWCRECSARIRGEARKTNPTDPAKARIYSQTYKERNPEAYKATERRQALRKFNMTPEEYDAKWTEQAGLCAICQQPEDTFDSKIGRVRKLAVDHCHTTGDNRGLLCTRCNTAIGLMQDNPDRLRTAADYIERSRSCK